VKEFEQKYEELRTQYTIEFEDKLSSNLTVLLETKSNLLL